MKGILPLFLLLVLATGCNSYDRKDFFFSTEEEAFFDCFHVDKPLYYQSNRNDTDTIAIAALDIEVNSQSGVFMASPAFNSRIAYIKHLPVDHWTHSFQNGSAPPQTEYQTLLRINKLPQEKRVEYSVSFKDFSSTTDSVIGEYHNGLLRLNDLVLREYYIINRPKKGRPVTAKSIMRLYWTKADGLVAYEDNSGEVWTRIELNDF